MMNLRSRCVTFLSASLEAEKGKQKFCPEKQGGVCEAHYKAKFAGVCEANSKLTADRRSAQHSTAQHSTAQHSTAQHSTAQHSVIMLIF